MLGRNSKSLRSTKNSSKEFQYFAQNSLLQHCAKIPLAPNEYRYLDDDTILILSTQIVLNKFQFYKIENTIYACLEYVYNSSIVIKMDVHDAFRNCKKMVLKNVRFYILPNHTLYVDEEEKYYNQYILYKNKIYVCEDDKGLLPLLYDDHQTGAMIKDEGNTVKEQNITETDYHIAKILYKIADAATFISIVCLFAHLICFMKIKEMRNLPGINLASLSVSLIFAYAFNIWEDFMFYSAADNLLECRYIGMFTNVFYLASFLWMNSIAFDICRSLYTSTKCLRLSGTENKWRKYIIYAIYSWGCAIVLLIIFVVLEFNPGLSDAFKPSFSPPNCDYSDETKAIYFFFVPLGFVLITNIVFFSISAYLIKKCSFNTDTDISSHQRINFSLYLRLAIIMGLTWIASLLTIPVGYYLEEVSEILNMLQGTFIFIFFTCSHPKVKALFKKVFLNKPVTVESKSLEHRILTPTNSGKEDKF